MPQPGMLGLIAGGGMMPVRVADAAAKTGRPVFCVLIQGFAMPADFERFPHEVVPLGQIGRMLGLMRGHGAEELVLAGRVARPSLLSFRFDTEGLRLVGKLGKRAIFGGDDGLLSAVLRLIEEEGFQVRGAQEVLGDLMVEAGVLTARAPDALQRASSASVPSIASSAITSPCCTTQHWPTSATPSACATAMPRAMSARCSASGACAVSTPASTIRSPSTSCAPRT